MQIVRRDAHKLSVYSLVAAIKLWRGAEAALNRHTYHYVIELTNAKK